MNISDPPSRRRGADDEVNIVSEKDEAATLDPRFLSAIYARGDLRRLGSPSPTLCGVRKFLGWEWR